MENSYNNLLEEAYSCLASKNYKKAINIFEIILETDKNSYEALFGLILAQNKCSSKELFLNDIELVSSNIDSLDKVIELCDKDIAIKEIDRLKRKVKDEDNSAINTANDILHRLQLSTQNDN